MTSRPGQAPADLVARLTDRVDLSARSVLVTVFGDTIAPLGGEVWLADLFELMAPFGYSERLVRTSLSRLVADDWCESVRDGRRSRYRLTDGARRATEEAERRIYHRSRREWTGTWTLVLAPDTDPTVDELRWNGFARLAPGVHALPHDPDGRHRRVVDRLGLIGRLPVADATFADASVLAAQDRLTDGFDLGGLVDDYWTFCEAFGPIADTPRPAAGPGDAFALRTLLVHEFRRLRLRDPELPAQLLPSPWAGDEAFDVAAAAYAAVNEPAWRWVAAKLSSGLGPIEPGPAGADPDTVGVPAADRFAAAIG